MKLAGRLMEFKERKNKTKQYHNDGSMWEMAKVGGRLLFTHSVDGL